MDKRIMAVYDVDSLYADRFADFANQKEEVPFTVMAFTALDRLRSFAAKNQIEILLINASVGEAEIKKIAAGQIVTLADGEVVELKDQYPSVYKYQSTDSIIREVMAYYCEKPAEDEFSMLGASGSVIGVYSPVNRCLKTSFALTLGQLMGKDAKVLYLNLEDCSGFSRLLGDDYKGDLSDLLYYHRQGNYSWARLSSVIYTWGALDYIPPARYPEDLTQVTSAEMADLLARVSRESAYEAVIVDLGQFGKNAAAVLEICDVVYMPVKEDCVSVAKLEEFEDYLAASGHEKLAERIQKLKLPYHNSFGRKEDYMEQLLWGELGDYIRQMLRGGR